MKVRRLKGKHVSLFHALFLTFPLSHPLTSHSPVERCRASMFASQISSSVAVSPSGA